MPVFVINSVRTASSTRGRADETRILAIYFTVLLCSSESKGGKSARSTCTITPPQEVTVGPSASNGDEDPWYIPLFPYLFGLNLLEEPVFASMIM